MRRGKKTYYFKRSSSQIVNVDTGSPVAQSLFLNDGAGGGFTGTVNNYCVSLSLVPGYTEFQSMFDEFRIKAVKVSFIPMANVSDFSQSGATGATGGDGSTGTFTLNPVYGVRSYSALDFNMSQGSDVISTLEAIRQYQNCKWKPYNRIHSRYFYPKPHLENGSTSAYTLKEKPWFSTALSANTLYNGILFGVDPINIAQQTVLYKIETKYYLQFRGPK